MWVSNLHRVAVALAVGAAFLFGSAAASAQEVLNVWWVKGFYKSEDDALFVAIKKFEQKTGLLTVGRKFQFRLRLIRPGLTIRLCVNGEPKSVLYSLFPSTAA